LGCGQCSDDQRWKTSVGRPGLPNQALYLKYRPHVFEDMIGQEHITHSLQNALAQDRIRHAYLFSGPRGTGKTTLARILAKAVNCTYPDPRQRPCDVCDNCQAIAEGRYLDLIEIDAASNNGVDDVRELRDKIGFSPSEGRFKVYVIDEVHRFSGAAFDALLKTLEEPPDHALFILATTELDKVPATIKSRCLKFEFRRVPVQVVSERLAHIARMEHVSIDPAALDLIARQGTGSVRDSISLLDQVIADPAAPISREDAEQILGTAGYNAVSELAQAIIEQNVALGLETLNRALDEGADPRQLGGQLIDYLHNVLLVQIGGIALVDTSEEQRGALKAQADQAGRGTLLRSIRAFNTALSEMRSSWQPQLPLELALVEASRSQGESAADAEPPRRKAAPALPPPAADPPTEEVADTLPADGTPAPSITLAEVQAKWPTIIAALDHKPTVALLGNASLYAIEGDQLVLAVSQPTFIEKLRDATKQKALIAAIKKVLRVSLRIKVIQVQTTTDQPLSEPLAKFAQKASIESVRREDVP